MLSLSRLGIRWRRLTEDEKARCAGVVTERDLDDMVLVFTPLVRHWGASATTLGSVILTDPRREGDAGFDELMAHEAVHVEQWRDRGLLGFGWWYLSAYVASRMRGLGHWDAYAENPSEVEARERAEAHFK